MRVHLPDGVSFINEEIGWWDKTFHKDLSRWARVPRDREAMHFLIVGDSGTGKSAAIRQLLSQIWERGEAAIVYDPAMEYLPQFYNEARGDVILNPMDARCPFWTPGDEVPHEAEALTLAAQPVPGSGPGEPVLRRSAEENLRAPDQSEADAAGANVLDGNADEIDKRVDGTELAAMIDKGAANQRSGCSGVAEHGGGCVQTAAQRVGNEAALEHGRVGEGAQRMGVPDVETDDAGEDAPAHQPVAGLACIASDE